MNTQLQPIAIVGMACRFPKELNNIEQLWHALKHKISSFGTVPPDRWTFDRFYSSNPVSKGKAYIQGAGFLTQDVRSFDANFFGISPRDAENMDPQQRLLLEVVWEAFEYSGMILPDYAKRQVGVYVGGFMLDHMINQMVEANRSAINQNTAAGMMMTMLSNRISHTFDFRGPSLSIDTACSSSLVAFHYACQDIWRDHCELAVVGGANVMMRPEYPMGMCKGHFLAVDGQCKSFDSRGDGYGRGEGAGIVLLQPLDKAIQQGNPILATVIATGSNQDGRTPGISMPSGEAQLELIKSVCARYDIDPATIEYVECHGTGTAIGDPTETKAIGTIYGAARKAAQKSPVIVGTIKSNIGHLEAAAGVAGVIKATLTLVHRETSPLANLQEVNPKIDLQELHVELSDTARMLSKDCARVAVNSFGYGGSNAHAILQSAPNEHSTLVSKDISRRDDAPYFMPVSAKSEKALQTMAKELGELIDNEIPLNDLLHTLTRQKAHLTNRFVVKGIDRASLRAGLRSFENGEESSAVVKGSEPFSGGQKPVFVFTGMGPQWWGMGQELYQNDLVYRQAVEIADEAFQRVSGFSILEEMLKGEETSQIYRTEFAQPANFLIQIGLLETLRAYGVEPAAAVGHSVGELSSAYAAGVLSLHDAMTVCFYRSQLQAKCRGTGAMLAVGLSADAVRTYLEPYRDQVSIAAINGPTNITIAGDTDAIREIALQLTAKEIFNKELQVEVPYHSPMMDPIMEELRSSLAQVQPSAPRLPLYSTVTGDVVRGIAYGADYWPQNVRMPVEFAKAIDQLLVDGYSSFLEVGPHPVLATSIQDCVRQAGKESRQTYTLRRNQPEVENVHRSVMTIIANGGLIDWDKVCPLGQFTKTPSYPWQRELMWVENDRAMQIRIAPIDYPILGQQEAAAAPVYRVDFDHEPLQYLRDHVVSGVPILPAAAFIESLLELGTIHYPDAEAIAIRNLSITAPMVITEERGLDSVTSFDPISRWAIIRSLENGRMGAGQDHVSAQIVCLPGTPPIACDLQKIRDDACVKLDVVDFYRGLDRIGLSYGPAFQTITDICTNPNSDATLCTITVKPEWLKYIDLYVVHPTLLDACFQALMPMLRDTNATFLPTGFRELCVYRKNLPTVIHCYATLVSQNSRRIECDLTLLDDSGMVVAALRGMNLSAAGRRERVDNFGDKVKRQILGYEWQYGETLTEPKRLGHWLIVGDESALAQRTMDQLSQFGATIIGMVTFGSQYAQDSRRFTVRHDSRENFARVLNEVGELDGIACLHGIAANEEHDPTAEAALITLTSLTQALLRNDTPRLPRVYVVTRAAHEALDSDDVVIPAQSAINGFVRVAYNELEGLRFTSIDLPFAYNEDTAEHLVLELLCDDEHDEVALRGSLRLHSELLETDVLFDDRIERQSFSLNQPIAVRPLRSDVESVGTARILAHQLKPTDSDSIALAIESTLFPVELITNPNSSEIERDWIEIVARVAEVGSEVTDLKPGQRVCGFAPADLLSHMSGPRDDFAIQVIDEETQAEQILSGLSIAVRAQAIVSSIQVQGGETALVCNDVLGESIAHLLSEKGVRVATVGANEFRPGDYAYNPEEMAAAKNALCPQRGFDYLVLPLARHQVSFDFGMMASGGVIIDLDCEAKEVSLPARAAGLIRSDLSILRQNRANLERTLHLALSTMSSLTPEIGPVLPVGIHDLAWQKLPLSDTSVNLVLTYDQTDKDLPVVQTDDLQFKADASYLITGGFGGFGRKTAEWLVANGAKHLVLTGRNAADNDERRAFVKSLESQGATVFAAACDTANIDAVQKLLQHIEQILPPLKGVFHSGAVIQDQPIAEIDFDTFRTVMRSKALGAWNLHQLTRTLNLDHFVLYSSLANLVGNSRQAAYSSANGFLNGLARCRQQQNLVGTSVNWGAIADVGVVANDEKLEQFLRYTGLRGIESTEGLALLKIGLKRKVAQFGVTVITNWGDWARFETRGSHSPRFRSLIAADSQGADDSSRQALIEELSKLDPADQVELVASLIVEIVAHVLKSSAEDISFDRAINQLGVDSLMATEIQMTLDNQLGLKISILELIGDNSIRTLAAKSVQNLMTPVNSN